MLTIDQTLPHIVAGGYLRFLSGIVLAGIIINRSWQI